MFLLSFNSKILYLKVTEERNDNHTYHNQSKFSEKKEKSISQDLNNTSTSIPDGSNSSTMSYSQQLQQQQIDSSPISTQINKVLKKAKKDTEKKMLLNDDEF